MCLLKLPFLLHFYDCEHSPSNRGLNLWGMPGRMKLWYRESSKQSIILQIWLPQTFIALYWSLTDENDWLHDRKLQTPLVLNRRQGVVISQWSRQYMVITLCPSTASVFIRITWPAFQFRWIKIVLFMKSSFHTMVYKCMQNCLNIINKRQIMQSCRLFKESIYSQRTLYWPSTTKMTCTPENTPTD